jgi:hypothetical protein
VKVGDLIRHLNHGFIGIIVYASPNRLRGSWTVMPIEVEGWLRNCWESNMVVISESR